MKLQFTTNNNFQDNLAIDSIEDTAASGVYILCLHFKKRAYMFKYNNHVQDIAGKLSFAGDGKDTKEKDDLIMLMYEKHMHRLKEFASRFESEKLRLKQFGEVVS